MIAYSRMALLAHEYQIFWPAGKQRSEALATERYLWSVTPTLMAWPAVTLASGTRFDPYVLLTDIFLNPFCPAACLLLHSITPLSVRAAMFMKC